MHRIYRTTNSELPDWRIYDATASELAKSVHLTIRRGIAAYHRSEAMPNRSKLYERLKGRTWNRV